MQLLPIENIHLDQNKLKEIDEIMKSIYRLIIFSRHHLDDDLLDNYLTGFHSLQELLGIKNAQMEAQNEQEAEEYLKNLKLTLDFVIEEIVANRDFGREIQLFQLLRLVSPEASALHPNRYRSTWVQVGQHICPEPALVPGLVSELFFNASRIEGSIKKAIYFHHELIRIHPFADGNGRVTRIAKNWMFMYDLYPPIFINDVAQKAEYIGTLSNSFKSLHQQPDEWNAFTALFFDQELDRILVNAKYLLELISQQGYERESQQRIG